MPAETASDRKLANDAENTEHESSSIKDLSGWERTIVTRPKLAKAVDEDIQTSGSHCDADALASPSFEESPKLNNAEQFENETSDASRELHDFNCHAMSRIPTDDPRQKARSVIREDVKQLISQCLEAIRQSESLERENKILHEHLEAKNDELAMIRETESQLRVAISNLKNAIQNSCAQNRQHAQLAKSEAVLQLKIGELNAANESASMQSKVWQRQAEQYKAELQQSKAKFDAVLQEKLQLERDHRQTLTLAQSLQNNHTATDVEYYQRKVSDLSTQVQELFAVVSEKNRQIDELTHQIERNMTQNQILSARGAFKKRKHPCRHPPLTITD